MPNYKLRRNVGGRRRKAAPTLLKRSTYIKPKAVRGNLFDLRAAHPKRIKTSVMVSTDHIKYANPNLAPSLSSFAACIREEFKKDKNYVDLDEVTCNQNGSPIKGKAGGEEMFSYFDMGPLRFFRSSRPQTPHKSPKVKRDFEKKNEVKSIKTPPKEAKKEITYTLTDKKIAAVRRKRKKHPRRSNQNSMMRKKGFSGSGSANRYTKSILTRTPKRSKNEKKIYEWRHLWPSSHGYPDTNKGSSINNEGSKVLVIGTTHDNSNDMMRERAQQELAGRHGVIQIETFATLRKGTHIAKNLTSITTVPKKYSIALNYDSLCRTQPIASTEDYPSKFFTALDNALNKPHSPLKVSQNVDTVFYKRKVRKKLFDSPTKENKSLQKS